MTSKLCCFAQIRLYANEVYLFGSYLFNYEVKDEIVFLCLTDLTFSRLVAFNFLEDLRKEYDKSRSLLQWTNIIIYFRWFSRFGDKGKTVQTTYGMNSQFKPVIKDKMHYHNNDPEANKIKKVRNQIEEIKEEMVRSIDKVLERGDKIDILVEKTSDLSENALSLRKNASLLKSTVWWRNAKIFILIAFTLAAVIGVRSTILTWTF